MRIKWDQIGNAKTQDSMAARIRQWACSNFSVVVSCYGYDIAAKKLEKWENTAQLVESANTMKNARRIAKECGFC
jgi:hypothetical protein